jgi:hypothetical protein
MPSVTSIRRLSVQTELHSVLDYTDFLINGGKVLRNWFALLILVRDAQATDHKELRADPPPEMRPSRSIT